MPKDVDNLADAFRDEKSNGLISDLLAEEDQFDGRTLWRLGSWGVGAIASAVMAVLAVQSSDGFPRRDQLNLAEAANLSQQAQLAESRGEARRLAAAVETLNKDRDRLYSRVTVLEQGLDSVTGSITRQASAATARSGSADVGSTPPNAAKNPDASALPAIAPVASAPAATIPAPSPPLAKTEKPPETVAALPSIEQPASPEKPVRTAEFGIELGGANSIDGVRALWRGLVKSNKPLLGELQPIVVMKEGNDGLGMRLRLVAGPFSDAAAAAKTCAALAAAKRPCETSMFDGQKLTLGTDKNRLAPAPAPGVVPRKRAQPVAEQAPAPQQGAFSSIFSRGN